MKVGIVGLGAIGGYLAARLAAAGHEVSAIARGETLARVRTRGLVVDEDGSTTTARIAVTDDATTLGEQDLIIIAVKATALSDVAPKVVPLLGESTTILTA